MQNLIDTAKLKNKLWIIPTFSFCALFGLFAGQGSLTLMIAMIGLIAVILVVFCGIRVLFFAIIIGVPTVFVFPNNVIQSLPFVNTERFLFGCIIGLMTLSLVYSKTLKNPLLVVEKVAIAFLFIMIFSYCYAVFSEFYIPDPSQDAYFIIQYMMGFSGFMIARRMTWSKEQVLLLIDALLFVGVFMAGQAVVQFILGSDIFVPTHIEVPHASEGRVTGTFGNSSEYGAVATTILILGIYRFSETHGAMAKTFILGLLSVICICIILSKTRAPWLAAAVSVGLICLRDSKVRPMIITAGIVGAILAAVILPIFYDFSELQQRFSSLAPIYNRLSLWVSGISMGLQNPIFGVGFASGGFQNAHPYYAIDIGGISAFWAAGVGVPHNEFIHILALSGFVGLSLFVAIFVLFFRLIKSSTHHPKMMPYQRLFAIYTSIILLNWLLNGLFVDTGKFWFLMFLVFSMIGILVSQFKSSPNIHQK